MYRGTTPTNVFDVDVDLRNATAIFVTYTQPIKTTQQWVNVFEKTKKDITITENTLSVKLTQQDTLKLNQGEVEIQIRAKFANGNAIASNIIRTTADKILKDGEI